MTLEQRVEALEKQMDVQTNSLFAGADGKVYINDALIIDGKINAAQQRAAYNMELNISRR